MLFTIGVWPTLHPCRGRRDGKCMTNDKRLIQSNSNTVCEQGHMWFARPLSRFCVSLRSNE